MNLHEGCTACKRGWKDTNMFEGQCSRCKRCLECCGDPNIRYTCAWKNAQMSPSRRRASQKAYERWETNPNILSSNRRIV